MSVIDDLMARAAQLPVTERADLAQRLLLSIEAEAPNGEWEAAWMAELNARMGRFDRGESVPRDWREVLEDICQSLTLRRP